MRPDFGSLLFGATLVRGLNPGPVTDIGQRVAINPAIRPGMPKAAERSEGRFRG